MLESEKETIKGCIEDCFVEVYRDNCPQLQTIIDTHELKNTLLNLLEKIDENG